MRTLLAACFAVLQMMAFDTVHAAESNGVLRLMPQAIAYSRAADPPADGWQAARPGIHDVRGEAIRRGINPPTAWVRYAFDMKQPGEPFALFSDFMREHHAVYLNGVDLYRTNTGTGDLTLGWHRPLYVPLPAKLVHAGTNTILFRIESVATRPLSIGTVNIGPQSAVHALFERQLFFQITAPQIINGVLLILTLGTLLFWLVRPQELVFGWLSLVGAVWWFRNLHYFIDAAPFDDGWFWILTTDSIFVLMATVYGFAATFIALPGRRRVIIAAGSVCAAALAGRHLLVALGQNDTPSFLLTIPVAAATLFILGRECWREYRVENVLMAGAVALATAFAFHDLIVVTRDWDVAPVYLQPFGSLLVFSAFGFALGRRMLVALAVNEDVNQTLERRVAEATENLNRSEATRRALQVANAVEIERERMMREIHDGIGSTLITALAVAERRQESPGTIATLKRSITDLRIGVDSLEPIDGDVVMLLASLRHRMEREINDAGLAFVWKVEAAPVLPWLDAVAALHVLRILQEAVGNILQHARAQVIEVYCGTAVEGGAPGVRVIIADDGRGFDTTVSARGRGLANMHARAEALSAVFTCDSRDGGGTRLSLWLPVAGGPAI